MASWLAILVLASCAAPQQASEERLRRVEEELALLREDVARLEDKIDTSRLGEPPAPPAAQSASAEPLAASCGGEAIPWEEASAHVGELRIVAGEIVLASYRPDISGSPTFLNYHDPFQGYFTALIWGDDRPRFVSTFGPPEEVFLDQVICVSGLIEEFRGSPEIILRDPAQVWLP